MGFLSEISGTPSNIENQLRDQYLPAFQAIGMSLTEAKSTFQNLFQIGKQEAEKEDSIDLPLNLGDVILKKEATEEGIKSMLAKRRKEGVRDEDIRWWMNRHELDRKMIAKFDEITRMTLYRNSKDKGMSDNEAAAILRKYLPIYGDPEDTSNTSGDDRPLPYELKDRIDIYIQKRSQSDPFTYKSDIEQSTTFNALVRREIQNRNI